MQKKVIVTSLFALIVITIFSSVVTAKLFATPNNPVLFHQPNAASFLQQKPFESAGNGFEQRKALRDVFPKTTDARVRKADLIKVTQIRSMLEQTLNTQWYNAPNFKTLSCAGARVFDKDRSMIQPLAEMSCLRSAQVPNVRRFGFGTAPFLTGSASRSITGMAVASGIATQVSECNDRIKEDALATLQGILSSERSLVESALETSTCAQLVPAHTQFVRASTHRAGLRFSSAVNDFEGAWRKAVSCVCSTLG